MSTLSLAPSFLAPSELQPAVQSGRRLGLRLTRRGRVVVVVTFLALALVLAVALGGWAAASRDAASAQPVRVFTVQPGDTLYSIAGRLAAPGQVRTMIHRIQELNSLAGSDLRVGQQIAVPRATSLSRADQAD